MTNPVVHEPHAEPTGAGMGLIGLTERVALLGGTLTHGRQGGTFTLRARLPWAT